MRTPEGGEYRALCGVLYDALGYEMMQWYGEDAVFLSAGGYHYIGLNTWAGRNVPPAPRESAGLFHLAILYPERRELARALRMVLDAEYPLNGASDCEALYLRDPDDNCVEFYWERPREAWTYGEEGNLAMAMQPLDLRGLLADLDGAARGE